MSDTTNSTNQAEHDALKTVVVAEIVQTARGLGVQHLPDVDRMVAGRVWPGGHGWVGEIGEGSNIRAVGDMYESIVDAIKAVDAEIRQLRDAAVNALMNGGEQAAHLAATRDHWQPPILTVFAEIDQQEPWLLQITV